MVTSVAFAVQAWDGKLASKEGCRWRASGSLADGCKVVSYGGLEFCAYYDSFLVGEVVEPVSGFVRDQY